MTERSRNSSQWRGGSSNMYYVEASVYRTPNTNVVVRMLSLRYILGFC